jgi:hypothetical protein
MLENHNRKYRNRALITMFYYLVVKCTCDTHVLLKNFRV